MSKKLTREHCGSHGIHQIHRMALLQITNFTVTVPVCITTYHSVLTTPGSNRTPGTRTISSLVRMAGRSEVLPTGARIGRHKMLPREYHNLILLTSHHGQRKLLGLTQLHQMASSEIFLSYRLTKESPMLWYTVMGCS